MKKNVFSNFFATYKSHLIHLELEEYLGWLTRSLPGMLGVSSRFLIHKLLLKHTGGFLLIYPGVYIYHTYAIMVGKAVSINTGAILDGRGGIKIGDYVMIGPNVCIASSNHNYRDRAVPVPLQGHVMQPVSIGDEVWIGANATILGGVTIGKGAVIAAGAVVVKDVEENQIVGGVPAKDIGHRE
jgi:acetyltransferase-like isoleucine patch superfamily enzyme